MDIIANAHRHLVEATGKERMETVEVPEWGDEEEGPLVIHYYPSQSLSDKGKISDAINRSNSEGLATALILWSRDAEGKRLFKMGQKADIQRKFDGEVTERVVTEMWNVINVTEESPWGVVQGN